MQTIVYEDKDYVIVKIAIAVADNRDAEMEQDRGYNISCDGIDVLSIKPESDQLLDTVTNVDGKVIASGVVLVKVPKE